MAIRLDDATLRSILRRLSVIRGAGKTHPGSPRRERLSRPKDAGTSEYEGVCSTVEHTRCIVLREYMRNLVARYHLLPEETNSLLKEYFKPTRERSPDDSPSPEALTVRLDCGILYELARRDRVDMGEAVGAGTVAKLIDNVTSMYTRECHKLGRQLE